MKTVFFLSIVVCLASSCRKFEEIKKYSLLTSHDRMSKDWKLISKTENKTAIDLTGFDVRLELNKDNTYTMTNSHKLFNHLITVEKKGNWFFRQEKKKEIGFLARRKRPCNCVSPLPIKRRNLRLYS